MRYELSDCEWSVIRPMLPNKPRGIPRVDDRRILNGIFWVLRSCEWQIAKSTKSSQPRCGVSL
jgi:transposase